MSEVQFNEPASTVLLERPKRGITGWLIKSRFARDERGAAVLMLAASAAFLILTAFLWMSGFATGASSGVSEQERARLEALP